MKNISDPISLSISSLFRYFVIMDTIEENPTLQISMPDKYKTDKYARSGSGHVARSESDPPARSGRLCMLPLVLIRLRSVEIFASFIPDLNPVILPDLI